MQPDVVVAIQLLVEALESVIRKSVSEGLSHLPPATPTEKSDEWLTRDEVTQLLHISLPTLRELEKRKELIPARVGRRVLYSRKAVEQKLRSGGKS